MEESLVATAGKNLQVEDSSSRACSNVEKTLVHFIVVNSITQQSSKCLNVAILRYGVLRLFNNF